MILAHSHSYWLCLRMGFYVICRNSHLDWRIDNLCFIALLLPSAASPSASS